MSQSWITPTDVLLYRLDAEFYGHEYVEHARLVISKRSDSKLGLKPFGQCGHLFSGPFGSRLPSHLYRDRGIPLFRVQNVYPVFPEETNLVFLDEATQEDLKNSEVLPGDLMLSKAGRLGDASLLPAKFQRGNITEHVIGFRPEKGLDSYFVLAALNSHFAAKQLERFGIGTLINYLGVVETRSVEIPAPSDYLQKAVGNYLRQAERLREIAEADWNTATGLLSQGIGTPLSRAFFEEFNWHKLGDSSYCCLDISPPIGWTIPRERIGAQLYHPRRIHAQRTASRVRRAEPLVTLAKRSSKRASGTTIAKGCVGLDRIDSKFGIIFRTSAVADGGEVDAVTFGPDAILFSKLRPYLNKVAIWPDYFGSGCGSTELMVYQAYGDIHPFYLFFVLKSSLGLYQVIDITTGSTHPRVLPEDVDEILVPRLDQSVENHIGELVSRAHQHWYRSQDLVADTRNKIEALIAGNLDESALLADSAEIEEWLQENPSPYASK